MTDNVTATSGAGASTGSSDPVNHPTHYAEGWSNGAEVIDITENLSFNRGNAVKYTARAGRKDPDKELEDLQKAAWYLDREIELVRARWDNPPTYQTMSLGDFLALREPKPRVWESVWDVPVNVVFEDADEEGWRWKWAEEGGLLFRYGVHDWRVWDESVSDLDEDIAPFTEVLS